MRRNSFRFLLGSVISLCLLPSTAALGQSATQQQMARRATDALKAARNLDVPKSQEVTSLILQQRFEEFERRSKAYEAKFALDPVYESPLIKLYDALERSNNKVLEKLDKWVASRPSYISYAARGVWKERRGYWLRGGEFIERMPPEAIASMSRVHDEARRDLLIALEMNSKFVPAYNSLIRTERARGSRTSAKAILATAVREIPQTYYVRFEYLQILTPRWGGSYKKMQTYTDDLDNKAMANARIWSLKGEAFADRGERAWNAGDYEGAIRHYTAALSYGDRMEFLKHRGYLYMTLSQYDRALADLIRYREYDRNNAEVNQYISRLTSASARASR
jgi:tetratricopeptide (TPR) repeat protein